jgi:hypothetical protein
VHKIQRLFWQTAFGKWRLAKGIWRMAHIFGKFLLTSRANLAALNIGEIEQPFFHQTLCAGNFLLSEKVW